MPMFHDLWISGGEPFLRKDLAKIIRLFYLNNQVKDVRIPTNGLPTVQTLSIVTEILQTCPNLHLEIDISIDGTAETHNRIRGVPNNFEQAIETLNALQRLRNQHPNLTLYVNSVITRENEIEIPQLANYFKSTSQLDGHYFQIIRGDPKDPQLQSVSPARLRAIYDHVLPLNLEYVSNSSRNNSLINKVKKAYWKAGYKFTYETQYQNYVHQLKWKMPCTAGRTSIVIDYNGDVRVCELRKPIGNLRKHKMNFQIFWNSNQRKDEVRRVKNDQCFCTHICFMYDSMRHSKRIMLWELPKTYLSELFSRNSHKKAQERLHSMRPEITVNQA
jgi:MoaA/NifB/PqqE/SkfB family radical SAM enzyme